jgi:pimeloyl-ACP methyl ester carboxylesterase
MQKEGYSNPCIFILKNHSIKQLCLCILHILILTTVSLSQFGCYHAMGSVIVKAPNAGKSITDLNNSNLQTLISNGVDYQLRVDVGPPHASLSAWVIEPKNEVPENKEIAAPKGTIIILHGYKDSKDNYTYMTWGMKFAEEGYRSVLVDLRGHGQSTGQWVTYGVVESRDISQLITALNEKKLLSGKVGVFGRSYGAAVAIQVAAVDRRVKAVVAVEPFRSMREMIPQFTLEAMGPFAFLCSISEDKWIKGIDHAGQIAGFNTFNASAYNAVAKIDTPIMFIHGNTDLMVPPWHSKSMYDRALGPSRLLILDNENHDTLGANNINRIEHDVIGWFNSWLPNYAGGMLAERD